MTVNTKLTLRLRDVLTRALALDFADFEDAVLHEAASVGGMQAIVTRDRQGFANAALPVFDPHELLAAIAAAAEETGGLPLTVAQQTELDRRLAELEGDPAAGESWATVRARIERRLDKAE